APRPCRELRSLRIRPRSVSAAAWRSRGRRGRSQSKANHNGPNSPPQRTRGTQRKRALWSFLRVLRVPRGGDLLRASSPSLLFPLQKRLLPRGSPTVATGGAVRANNTMTRYGQRDRIRRARARHGAHRTRPADRFRDLTVGARLAIRNRGECLPDQPLERRRL